MVEARIRRLPGYAEVPAWDDGASDGGASGLFLKLGEAFDIFTDHVDEILEGDDGDEPDQAALLPAAPCASGFRSRVVRHAAACCLHAYAAAPLQLVAQMLPAMLLLCASYMLPTAALADLLSEAGVHLVLQSFQPAREEDTEGSTAVEGERVSSTDLPATTAPPETNPRSPFERPSLQEGYDSDDEGERSAAHAHAGYDTDPGTDAGARSRRRRARRGESRELVPLCACGRKRPMSFACLCMHDMCAVGACCGHREESGKQHAWR
jgi:hypothetical protein